MNKLFTGGGNGYLTTDITVPGSTVLTTEAGKTVSLCLNGKTISLGQSSRFNIYGTFNLYGYEGGAITGGYCSNGGTVYVFSGGTFNMHSGTIQNSKAYGTSGGYGLGGAVYVNKNGTMNMYGGTIKDCIGQRYAGAVETYGLFNMYGGTIDNCIANTNNGGGVEIEASGTMNMYGGTISGCKAESTSTSSKGGGVSVTNGPLNMYGGTITGCKAYNGGGAVYVAAGKTFTMYGGKITNCSATFGGGVNYAGTFTMNGGYIDTCTCTGKGGGVYGWSNGLFTLNGGTIQNCTVPQDGRGAGVCLIGTADHGRPKMVMTGGTIRNNKTGNKAHGGGVYVLGGEVAWNGKSVPTEAQFTMSGGEISGNYAYWSGGGVFCEAEGSFLMTGGTIKNNTSGSYGSGVGVYQTDTTKGDATSWIYIKGGTISGNTVKKDTKGRAMMWKETVTGSGSCSYNGSYPGNVDVSNWNALTTAVSAALTDGTPQVITLQANITGDSRLTIPYDKNIILNLNGHDLTKSSTSNAFLYPCRCPIYIVNTSSTKSKISGGSNALYLYNGGDGYGGSNAWGELKAHIIGNIEISKIYVAGGTHIYYETPNVKVNSYSSGEGNDQRYKITLDANGGSGSPDEKYRAINSSGYGLPTVAPNREGYTLKGWNSVANGSGTNYRFTLAENGVKTLYAQWSQDQTLIYDKNGQGYKAPDAVTMYYDKETTAAYPFSGKVGYTFANWNTKADGTGDSYEGGAQIKAANVDPVATTLYAQWKANEYTVSLNNGSGSGATSLTATYDSKLPNVGIPTWEKHYFVGYFTGENGQGEKYIDHDGKGIYTWTQDSNEVTLYAYWVDSANIESMDLLLGGDIGVRYHVAVGDPALQQSGTMTVSVGGKKSSSITKSYSEVEKDQSGAVLFPFNVSSIQMAEPITVEFKDESGNTIAEYSQSIEDYYNIIKDSDATAEQKEMVRTLVDYGYYAQQALSKTRGWGIGTDYAASTLYGSLQSTAQDLQAYKPVISGTGVNVKDIQISLLLDNKTTLCVYVQTKDGQSPDVTVDRKKAEIEDNGDGWWLVRISDIDALNLSTMHTVTVNGYTVYLSALSYASVAGDADTVNAMRALMDYYKATLKASGKKEITSAQLTQSEYEYRSEEIIPAFKAYAGNEEVTGCKIDWSGELINAGSYTGLVSQDDCVGGAVVKLTITPMKVAVPKAVSKALTYNGYEQTGVGANNELLKAEPKPLGYTLENNTATNAGEYIATAELNNTEDVKNYCWEDGSTDPKTIEWSIAKKAVEIPTAANGLVYSRETQIGVKEGEGYTLENGTAINAGEYKAIARMSSDNYCWSDSSTDPKTIEWSIAKKTVKIPTAADGLVYSGYEQTGVAKGEGYTLENSTAINAGEYTAIAKMISDNYCWSGGSAESKTINWSIAKATPTQNGTIEVTYYPNGESTTFGGGSMSVEGTFSYDPNTQITTFIPNDTNNYNEVNVTTTVTIDETVSTPNVPVGSN